jgi:hypothetical protein
MVIWLTILVAMLLAKPRWSWAQIGVWVLAAIGCIGFYFTNFTFYPNPVNHGFLYYLTNPHVSLIYLTGYIGSPIAGWESYNFVAIFGLLGLALFAVALFLIWHLYRTGNLKISFNNFTVWISLCLFVVFCAGITMLGRGILASRYTTIAILFWIGLGTIWFLLIQNYLMLDKPKVIISVGLSSAVAGFILTVSLITNVTVFAGLSNSYYQRALGLFLLYDYQQSSEETLGLLYPYTNQLERKFPILITYQQSIFNPAMPDYRKNFVPANYSTKNFQTLSSDFRVENDNEISFKIPTTKSVSIAVSGQDLYQNRATSILWQWKPSFMQIETGQLLREARVVWDTNPGVLSETYMVKGTNGKFYYWIAVPGGVNNFQLNLKYEDVRAERDSLRLSLMNKL